MSLDLLFREKSSLVILLQEFNAEVDPRDFWTCVPLRYLSDNAQHTLFISPPDIGGQGSGSHWVVPGFLAEYDSS